VRFLPVDDEPDALELNAFILKNQNAKVETADSAVAALLRLNEQLRSNKI
jgi:CheY-like chemotaxis protein